MGQALGDALADFVDFELAAEDRRHLPHVYSAVHPRVRSALRPRSIDRCRGEIDPPSAKQRRGTKALRVRMSHIRSQRATSPTGSITAAHDPDNPSRSSGGFSGIRPRKGTILTLHGFTTGNPRVSTPMRRSRTTGIAVTCLTRLRPRAAWMRPAAGWGGSVVRARSPEPKCSRGPRLGCRTRSHEPRQGERECALPERSWRLRSSR